jgi:hypothetical protein
MALYLARVELHKAGEDDYAKLQDQLKVAGFHASWMVNNVAYRLPTGTYCGTADSLATAYTSVRKVASSVGFPIDIDTGPVGDKTSQIVIVGINGATHAGSKRFNKID